MHPPIRVRLCLALFSAQFCGPLHSPYLASGEARVIGDAGFSLRPVHICAMRGKQRQGKRGGEPSSDQAARAKVGVRGSPAEDGHHIHMEIHTITHPHFLPLHLQWSQEKLAGPPLNMARTRSDVDTAAGVDLRSKGVRGPWPGVPLQNQGPKASCVDVNVAQVPGHQNVCPTPFPFTEVNMDITRLKAKNQEL